MINVLLISPRLDKNHNLYGGDNGYTHTLLENPPMGVRYYHYEDWLEEGKAKKISACYHLGPRLVNGNVLPPDLWAEYLELKEFPDLIHIYAYSAKVKLPSKIRIPIILHTSSPSITDLTVKLNWNQKKVNRYYRRMRAYLLATQSYHYALNPRDATNILVQTIHGRDLLRKYGRYNQQPIDVLYPAQPIRKNSLQTARKDRDHLTFLFVGSQFERKNGSLVLQAFKEVHSKYPDTRLIVVGKPAHGNIIEMDGVEHHLFVQHDLLISQIFPRSDVLVLPTSAEGGFSFSLFEAMSFGIPAITVDAWAMPEIITDGLNGFLISDCSADIVAERMLRLATDLDLLEVMSRNSSQVFSEKFSIERHNQLLHDLYVRALDQCPS